MSKLWLLLLVVTSLGASELRHDDNITLQEQGAALSEQSVSVSPEQTPTVKVSKGLMSVGNKMQVYATKIDSNNTKLHASGDVLILYKDQYLSANSATYDRDNGELELSGNIVVMQGADYFALGEYATFNLDAKERTLTPFYMTDKKSRVWLSCEKAHALDKDFDLQSGVMSGCNPTDPLWQIYFSSSDYNSETKWLNIYNARLYIHEIPVFYAPYFGYSLDTTRRTGLLPPSFGLSSSEGFYYEQPIYIAEYDEWDLELRPQIRTKRGEGIYATFRFVDSKISRGEITTGVFKEKSDYFQEYQLQNNKHYGFNIYYENYNFLKQWFGLELSGQSGFYTDINWMNDVDYINLASRNDETRYATTNQVFSRINTFYNEDDHYLGTYFKYYRDLNSDKNDETLQNLPTIHYHHYLESFLDEHLLANVDIAMNNLYRPTGKRAIKSNVDIPLILQTSVLDDYLDLSYQASLNGRHISFGGTPDDQNLNTEYESGQYYRNVHTINAGTYLTRGYDDFAHTMAFKTAYTKAGSEYRDGFYEGIDAFCDPESPTYDPAYELCSYYNVNEVEEESRLEMVQYLFDESGKQFFYHRITQGINHEENNELGELENDFIWQITDAISFNSDTFWDHQNDYLSKQVSGFGYNDGVVQLNLNHFFEDKLRRNRSDDSSYLTSRASYRYDRHYRYFAGYDYDFQTDLKKKAEIGFMYQQRCFDFGLRYVENNRPILQSGGVTNSIYDKYIFITVMLKPMGGTEFDYKFDDE